MKRNTNTHTESITSEFSTTSEASMLYTNRYFFRLVSTLQHLRLLYVDRAFMYTPVVCHFSSFYTVEDFHHLQKEAAILYFSCGCTIVSIYILKKKKKRGKKLLQVGFSLEHFHCSFFFLFVFRCLLLCKLCLNWFLPYVLKHQ